MGSWGLKRILPGAKMYSSLVTQPLCLKSDPNLITGFIDAEGSFVIIFRKNLKLKLGFQVQASFQLRLHSKDRDLLLLIKSFFLEKLGLFL